MARYCKYIITKYDVSETPLGEARKYERGQTLLFGLTLFGTIIQLLPYIVMSVHVLEENGLGRKLPENAGERGRFRITQIDAFHPRRLRAQSTGV